MASSTSSDAPSSTASSSASSDSSTSASSASSKASSSSSSTHSATFTPTIPDSSENPFLSSTSLPEGTLFIAVGSILLGIILMVLLWRIYAIWASRRAAQYNETKFTALEPSYGGPFVDPVVEQASESDDDRTGEKGPEVHPTGVPLNPNSKTRALRQRPKSQADRVREAHLQGKFVSPTAEVLMHGTSLSSTAQLGSAIGSSSSTYLPSGYYTQQPHSSRFSVVHSGRNSIVQQASMSSTDLSTPNNLSAYDLGAPSGPPMGPASGPATSSMVGSTTGFAPMGPPEGSSNGPEQRSSRPKKMRPPSMYLDDLIG